MIKANELRIGNWVSNGEKNFTVDVNVLYDMALPGYELSPIPLDGEMVEKAGFIAEYVSKFAIKYGSKHSGRHDEFGVNYYFPKSFYSEEGGWFVRYYSENVKNPIKYLHQLQNLYFSLTGAELEISL
jgi:hypothetical protein